MRHRLKTAGLWHLTQPAPGVFTWTTTTGREHTTDPPALRGE